MLYKVFFNVNTGENYWVYPMEDETNGKEEETKALIATAQNISPDEIATFIF